MNQTSGGNEDLAPLRKRATNNQRYDWRSTNQYVHKRIFYSRVREPPGRKVLINKQTDSITPIL